MRSWRSSSWIARELRALGVEVGLDPDLLALEHRDVGLQRADLVAVAGDRGREHALAALLLLDRAALLVDLDAQRGRARLRRAVREHGQDPPQDEREHCHREQEAEPGKTHAAGHSRTPPPVTSSRAPAYGACKESCSVQGFLPCGRRRASHVRCLRG